MSYILSSYLFPEQNIRRWNDYCPRTLRIILVWRNFYQFQHVNYGTFLICFKSTRQTERNWRYYAIFKCVYCVKKLFRILLEEIYRFWPTWDSFLPPRCVLRLFDIFKIIIQVYHHNTTNAAHFRYIYDGLNVC